MITHENIPPVFSNNNIAIRLHVDSNNTFYGNPHSSTMTYNLQEELRQSAYSEEIYYVNTTYKDITVMTRNGLAVTVHYVSSGINNGFIIRKIIKLKGKSLHSAITGIQNSIEVDDAELIEIKKALNLIDQKSFAFTSIMIDYKITLEDIRARGGTLYHYQTDLVVSFDDTVKIDAHPYSTKFLGIGTFGVINDYINQADLNLKIKYVNYDKNAGPIYVKVLGRVFTINPRRDAPARTVTFVKNNVGTVTYDDYVMLYYSSHCDPDVNNTSGVTVVRMSLDEAREKLGLYDNFTDAMNHGDSDDSRKSEILKLQHELEVLKQNTVIEKAKLEQENLVIKSRLEQEAILLKSRLEQEDNERKQILIKKEFDLEMLKKETAKIKQDLEYATQKLNTELLEHKKRQITLDIKMQELENERKQNELARRETDERLEKERIIFDQKIKEMRDDNEYRLKEMSMYWKDYYEARSYERKDKNEVVKFIPGLLLGIFGITTTIIKMS